MAFSKLTDWIAGRGGLLGKKTVYQFSEGGIEDRQLLGYKGSILCELQRLKIPIPSGFIVGSDNCTEYFKGDISSSSDADSIELKVMKEEMVGKKLSRSLKNEVTKHIQMLEQQTGRLFTGSACSSTSTGSLVAPPLLLSVRVSPSIHVPGRLHIYRIIQCALDY